MNVITLGISFNPPPAVRPGETATPGRELYDFCKFQSAPGGEAGGNEEAIGYEDRAARFNPPPAVRPGETVGRKEPMQARLEVSIRPRR